MNQKTSVAGKIVTIDKQVGGKGQAAFYRSVFALDGKRFLVDIKVNSHPAQSRSSISHWQNGTWHEIYALHPAEMDVDFNMGYRSEPVNEVLFDAVISRLVRIAREVCF